MHPELRLSRYVRHFECLHQRRPELRSDARTRPPCRRPCPAAAPLPSLQQTHTRIPTQWKNSSHANTLTMHQSIMGMLKLSLHQLAARTGCVSTFLREQTACLPSCENRLRVYLPAKTGCVFTFLRDADGAAAHADAQAVHARVDQVLRLRRRHHCQKGQLPFLL